MVFFLHIKGFFCTEALTPNGQALKRQATEKGSIPKTKHLLGNSLCLGARIVGRKIFYKYCSTDKFPFHPELQQERILGSALWRFFRSNLEIPTRKAYWRSHESHTQCLSNSSSSCLYGSSPSSGWLSFMHSNSSLCYEVFFSCQSRAAALRTWESGRRGGIFLSCSEAPTPSFAAFKLFDPENVRWNQDCPEFNFLQ